MDRHQLQPQPQRDVETLSSLAQLSNILAKQLMGASRTIAYRIKAQACSLLLISGHASVTGIWPDGIVSLDLASGKTRLHIRRSHLTQSARDIVDRRIGSVRAVVRLGECIEIERRKK